MRTKILTLFLCLVLSTAFADRHEMAPVIFNTGSSLTLQTGVTTNFQSGSITNFASGSTVNFTGSAVSGLPVFRPAGAGHATGAVPDPGSVVDSTKYLRDDGQWVTPGGGGGGGTVTSVSATGANGIVVTGSPVVAAGTLAFSLAGGTLGSNAFTSTPFEHALGNPGTNGWLLSSDTLGNRAWVAPPSGGGGGGGTVTSVAATGANGIIISGSPITTTGTLSLSLGAITPTSVNGNTFTTGTGTLNLGSATLIVPGIGGTLGSLAYSSSAVITNPLSADLDANGFRIKNVYQIFNIRDYGGTGDGVTDNSTAITRAAAAASAMGGGIVTFDAGTFVISSLQTISGLNHVSFQGSGRAVTIIQSTLPLGAAAVGDPTFFRIVGCNNFTIKGFTFDQQNRLTTNIATSMIQCQVSQNYRISECEFVNYKRIAIEQISCTQFWIENNYFARLTDPGYLCAANRCKTCNNVWCSGDPDCGPGWIINNQSEGAGFQGGGTDITYGYNRINNFTDSAGVNVNASSHPSRVRIIGNVVSNSGTVHDPDGFFQAGIECYGQHAKIIGNTCYNCSGTGISFGGEYTTVSSNLCYDNGVPSTSPGVGIGDNPSGNGFFGSHSVVNGNICRNINTTNQVYGYSDEGADNVGNTTNDIHFSGNNFSGNATSDFNKFANTSNYTWASDTLSAAQGWTPGAIPAGAQVNHQIAVVGATLGDAVQAGFDHISSGHALITTGYVLSSNQVSVTIFNPNAITVTLPNGIVYVTVVKKTPF